jgi:hypothetical protein
MKWDINYVSSGPGSLTKYFYIEINPNLRFNENFLQNVRVFLMNVVLVNKGLHSFGKFDATTKFKYKVLKL